MSLSCKYKLLTVFVFVMMFGFISFAQNTINFESCSRNCNKSLKVITDDSGTYTIKIVNSSGRVMVMPFYEKQFDFNEEIIFDFDIRYWKPGNYMLIVSNDSNQKSIKKIKITPRAF